jgi:hypothetical protein
MRLNGNMATEVAKGAFLPALKYGASSPTRCEKNNGHKPWRDRLQIQPLIF